MKSMTVAPADSGSSARPVTVSIVDDDPMICQAMTMILNDYSGDRITVVSTSTSGVEAVEKARKEQPDVVLMDIAMPNGDGIEATARMKALPSPPHVLILTSLSPSNTAERAAEAGAEGFVSKTDAPEEIINRILGACDGSPQFNPASQRQLLNDLHRRKPLARRDEARQLLNMLSEREREAVRLASEGFTNQEIAERMFISERTAKAHLSSASDKLAMNRIQLARLVERADLPPVV